MKKLLLILLITSLSFILAGCSLQKKSNQKTSGQLDTNTSTVGDLTFDYIIEDNKGICKSISDCQAVNYGCGKTVCTSNPDKYKDLITDCSVNKDQPALNGYRCGCVPTNDRNKDGKNINKCAWVK